MKKKFNCFYRIILTIGVFFILFTAKAQNTYSEYLDSLTIPIAQNWGNTRVWQHSDQYLDSVLVQVAQMLDNTKDFVFWISINGSGNGRRKVLSVSPSENFHILFKTKEVGDILVDFNQNIEVSTYNDCKSTNDPPSKSVNIGRDLLITFDLGYLSCGTPGRINAVKKGNEQLINLYRLLAPFKVRYEEQRQAYANSVNAARIAEEERKWNEFVKGVEEYKSSTVKPEITEEQRKFIVQANAQNEEKKYFSAIDLYEKAMQVNPYSYPAAYFNMALLYAQIQKYSEAILNMKKYLMIVPDAPDARAAQDKIYEWELKN